MVIVFLLLILLHVLLMLLVLLLLLPLCYVWNASRWNYHWNVDRRMENPITEPHRCDLQ
jgi:hypothetical protein